MFYAEWEEIWHWGIGSLWRKLVSARVKYFNKRRQFAYLNSDFLLLDIAFRVFLIGYDFWRLWSWWRCFWLISPFFSWWFILQISMGWNMFTQKHWIAWTKILPRESLGSVIVVGLAQAALLRFLRPTEEPMLTPMLLLTAGWKSPSVQNKEKIVKRN